MHKLISLPPKSVQFMIKDKAIMIDVRRKEEWQQTGIIKNSYPLTFFDEYGNHDAVNWMKKLQKITNSKDATIILICAHANRTKIIGYYLIQEHGYTNVAHLEGGISNWQAQGRDLEEWM